ncbi:MAG: dihydroorotate dehydrogenase electron transfer subunit [Oscillospiraceae bacterium]
MKQGLYTILHNSALTADTYRLVLGGDTSAFTAPGQFLDIRLPGRFLRRPISVSDWDEATVTVIYKLLGEGTTELSRMEPGAKLDVLTGLGNGYDLAPSGDRPLVIGGGVGIPPMLRLTKELLAQGKHPVVILGFNRSDDRFLTEEFAETGAEIILTTADGSAGIKGFVTDGVAAAEGYTYAYACGPTAMLKALDQVLETPAQYSFEERMGCGFGACMGCTCETKTGHKRVCKDGPVFRREEVLW